MTKTELETILSSESSRFRAHDDARWSFVAHGVPMQAFCSEAKDRMRVMAAVCYLEDVTEEQLRLLLRGSFHADARYAIHETTVFAAYLHPLGRLSETELRDGIRQVASMARTFGTRFAAGGMSFQWPRPAPEGSGIRRRTVEAVQKQLERARGQRD
ncbi:MAG: hypothetical protein RIF41_01930 [Polyangiaceae bacterium]